MDAGSTPVARVSPVPGARIGACFTTAVVVTPGVFAMASATPEANGWNP